jgi:hypothetical protein
MAKADKFNSPVLPPKNLKLVGPPQNTGLSREEELFIVANPDTPAGQEFVTPANGKNWVGRERFSVNLRLSPPQKLAVTLISQLTHSTGVQEYLSLLLERAVREDLKQFSEPAVGGKYAGDAEEALKYLETWGDQTIGRRLRGQRE